MIAGATEQAAYAIIASAIGPTAFVVVVYMKSTRTRVCFAADFASRVSKQAFDHLDTEIELGLQAIVRRADVISMNWVLAIGYTADASSNRGLLLANGS